MHAIPSSRRARRSRFGVVLTPIAALLAFVDPGLAKDAHCAALLAEAKTDGVHVNPAAPVH